MKLKKYHPDMRLALTLVISLGLAMTWPGCKGQKGAGGSPKAEGLQPEDVVGKWRARSLEISIESRGNSKRDSSFVLDARSLGAKVSRQPAMTVISADGEYREETRTLSDSLIQEANGYWHIFQDTLIFRLKGVNAAEMRYHAVRKGNRLMLESRTDFDGDLVKDDKMKVTLEKE